MENHAGGGMINAGSGQEISIAALAEMICRAVGFTGELRFDRSKPDGTPRKIMDNRRLFELGWRPQTDLEAGLQAMYEHYCARERSIKAEEVV
jgi:GDP-L-fucose synthase